MALRMRAVICWPGGISCRQLVREMKVTTKQYRCTLTLTVEIADEKKLFALAQKELAKACDWDDVQAFAVEHPISDTDAALKELCIPALERHRAGEVLGIDWSCEEVA
jgi:hypothetical protein